MERLFEDVRAAIPDDCRVTVWTCHNPSKALLPRLQDMWEARRHQSDVNHVTGDVHFLTIFLDPRRTVLTVHDLVVLRRLRGWRRFVLWFVWYWVPVRRSRMVVAISETTRQALIKIVRCDPTKVRVIHNSVSAEFKPMPRELMADCPRILQIGTKPNKNLERVAAALEGLHCRLIVIGELSALQVQLLKGHSIDYENKLGLSRADLLAEYVASDLVVFASTYEGFGLPIIEANAVGRPVVTSDISSMPEVAGSAACLIDPFSVASIRAGIERVITDEPYRRALVERGYANATRFSASAVAERYAELYREIAG